jgi:hypothetical protein
MHFTIIAIILSLVVAAPALAAPPAGDAVHAPQGAAPGSYEDWCGEHQVPESLDTRCNPALIPAFKATKDWCAEHGLPESQCLKCNPTLKIVRPPKGAVAGSYEDWCGEHQVPESLDTRCSPALIPAFKATKDWCAEHGLPESQCLKCNPDLKIIRPPKPAGGK